VTGLVSSPARAEFVGKSKGAVGALDRTDPRFKRCTPPVPDGSKAILRGWEAAGRSRWWPNTRRLNGGKLADYAVSSRRRNRVPAQLPVAGRGRHAGLLWRVVGLSPQLHGQARRDRSAEAMLQRAGARAARPC
jgi:acrylyl-CoA reductase (NADPH) / 3-hydroxypropionyl-CoA dehydratase / 3-hydroxypropionyl-CoA synthetase